MADQQAYETITLEKKDGVAILTLNRPDKMNTVTAQLRRDVTAAIQDVAVDFDTRVMVLTAAGKAFCAGADFSIMAAMAGDKVPAEAKQHKALIARVGEWVLAIAKLEKPTICAINGTCVGVGISIAGLCDIRIASDKARFSAVWVRRGLAPDAGSTYILPRLIGLEKTYELMYSGDMIDAPTAQRIGLVSQVVPHDGLMNSAVALAVRLAKGPPLAQALTKRAISRAMIRDLVDAFDYETYIQNICRKSEDHKEGVYSFLEKREPEFKGI